MSAAANGPSPDSALTSLVTGRRPYRSALHSGRRGKKSRGSPEQA